MKEPDLHGTVVKVFMWLTWVIFVTGCFFFAHFLTRSGDTAGATGSGPVWLAILALVLPFSASMVLRFLVIPKIRNPWIALFPYIVGVIISQQILFFGLFMFKGYEIAFFALCFIAMVLYIPYWVRLGQPKQGALGGGAAPGNA